MSRTRDVGELSPVRHSTIQTSAFHQQKPAHKASLSMRMLPDRVCSTAEKDTGW